MADEADATVQHPQSPLREIVQPFVDAARAPGLFSAARNPLICIINV